MLQLAVEFAYVSLYVYPNSDYNMVLIGLLIRQQKLNANFLSMRFRFTKNNIFEEPGNEKKKWSFIAYYDLEVKLGNIFLNITLKNMLPSIKKIMSV